MSWISFFTKRIYVRRMKEHNHRVSDNIFTKKKKYFITKVLNPYI